MSDSDGLDVRYIEESILQKEEELKQWCSTSGEDVGRMVEIPGSDDWKIHCPDCGTWWHGGSTVLPDHNRPRIA